MAIIDLPSVLKGRSCRKSASHSGFTVISQTKAASSVSCNIDDDYHKHVLEMINTRGYQVAYDIKVQGENRKLEFSLPYGKDGWIASRESHGARVLGRIDTPRKVPSLTYDQSEISEEERIDITRKDGSEGTEEIVTVSKCGAAEGSNNNSDPNDQGEFSIAISVTVR